MKRKKKPAKILTDEDLSSSQEDIIKDLKRRIDNLTGHIEEEQEGEDILLKHRNMTFATIRPIENYVQLICEVPYDRILDMSSKCVVEPYAGSNQTDVVKYDVKTKFDVQYAVSIVQQSFMFRKRLKL